MILANTTELSTMGMVFMLVVWTIVLGLVFWSYSKILGAPPPSRDDD